MEEDSQKVRRKGIYLLPNLFTTATLFGGFYAIIAGLSGQFSQAAAAILVAMVADSLDGRIARLTNTQSDFGKEYDSLCDMVAFGVAAGIVIYAFSLHHLGEQRWLGGKLGWVLAFTYTACAALRLARFNTLTTISGGKADFFGLPSPSAAALVAFFVWSAHRWGYSGEDVLPLACLVTLVAALLMVSSVRYESFKKVNLKARMRFLPFAAIVGGFALILIDPPTILFVIFFTYAASGPGVALWRRYRQRLAR